MERPLFRGHPMQSLAAGLMAINTAVGAAVIGHLLMRWIPTSLQTYSLIQTAVAVLALASMAVFIVMHHRQDGRVLTQTQEEIVLIIAFGLFWLAVLIATRAYSERSIDMGTASEASLADKTTREAGFTGGKRPYPCSSDAVACVVEEWAWF